jgi:protein phosphatase
VSLVARHAALTDIGLHRSSNEDAFVAEPPLFAVADGMGGARAGEIASHLALDSLVAALAADEALPAAAGAANQAVYGQSRSDRSRSGMGTTLTAVLLGDDRLRFVHVGDSRLYLWRDERLTQVTDDHSLVGEMVREGHLSREAAASHPQRSILSRALGTEPRVEIDSDEIELRAGDALLLCSDGLYSMVPEDTIAAVLAAVDDPARVARRLVSEAKNGGGHDNITVVVLRFDAAPADQAGASVAAAAAAAATAILPAVGDEPATIELPAVGDEPATTELPAVGDEPPTVEDELPETEAVAARAEADDAEADDAEADDAEADDAEADDAEAGDAEAPGAGAEAAPVAPRRRRRRVWLAIALAIVLAACLAAGATASSVYFVGDYDGMVSVYHGLPFEVAGVKLYDLYLETTTPVAGVSPDMRARVERHDLHRKAAALDLARRAQGLP